MKGEAINEGFSKFEKILYDWDKFLFTIEEQDSKSESLDNWKKSTSF